MIIEIYGKSASDTNHVYDDPSNTTFQLCSVARFILIVSLLYAELKLWYWRGFVFVFGLQGIVILRRNNFISVFTCWLIVYVERTMYVEILCSNNVFVLFAMFIWILCDFFMVGDLCFVFIWSFMLLHSELIELLWTVWYRDWPRILLPPAVYVFFLLYIISILWDFIRFF